MIYPHPKPAPKERTPRPLVRHTRLAPYNRGRKHRRFKAAYHSTGFVAWIRGLGCSVERCRQTDIVAAHVVARAAGGTWQDVIPLCFTHHQIQHTLGVRSFERRYGINLRLTADAVAQRWLAGAKENEQ